MEPLKKEKTVRFRPCLSTYLVVDGIPAFFLAWFVALCVQGSGDAWKVVLLASAFLALGHVWVRSHSIVLSDSEVGYQTLFSSRSIALSDVDTVRFEVGLKKAYWDKMRSRGFYRMVIQPHRETHIDPLVINTKLFSLSDIQAVASALRGATE